MPSELEYMIVSFDEPHVYLRQWNDESVFQEIQFSTQADCKLLECRNVTMQSVVKPFKIWGQIAVSSSTAGRLFDCTIMVDPIFISFGQYALHSLNTAIQAWQQVCKHNNEKECGYCDSFNSKLEYRLLSLKIFQDVKAKLLLTSFFPNFNSAIAMKIRKKVCKGKCSQNGLSFSETTWSYIKIIETLVLKCKIFH